MINVVMIKIREEKSLNQKAIRMRCTARLTNNDEDCWYPKAISSEAVWNPREEQAHRTLIAFGPL